MRADRFSDETKSDEKLAELILYVSRECQKDEKFGATKLNKILFYADFFSYRQFGHAITGQEYQHIKNGPAPKRLKPVREALIAKGDLALQTVTYFTQSQTRTIALRDPYLSFFEADEIAIVDRVIRELWNKNASEVSDLSHQFIGWRLAEDREVIPYDLALISEELPEEDEIEFGQALDTLAKQCLSVMLIRIPSNHFLHC